MPMKQAYWYTLLTYLSLKEIPLSDEIIDDASSGTSRAALMGLWICMTVIAGVLTAVFQASLPGGAQDLSSQLIELVVIAAAEGIVFGVLQWLILRLEIDHPIWWIPLTFLGTLIGAFLENIVLSALIAPLVNQLPLSAVNAQIIAIGLVIVSSSLVSGLMIGLGQWLVLRRLGWAARVWIPITILSIFVRHLVVTGVTVLLNGFTRNSTMNPNILQLFSQIIIAICGNLAFGALSGWVLSNILEAGKSEHEQSA